MLRLLQCAGMLKKFLMKKALQSQLKNVPEAQRAQILAMVDKNPKLFEQIAKEIQAEMKKGKDQMAAAMAVLPKYREELSGIMGPQAGGAQAQFNPNGTIRK